MALINADAEEDARELPDRLMRAVADLERFQGPLRVTRLEHSLQSATRALRGVQKHALFQSYYYADLMGADRNGRDKYRDHPFYDDCVEFCEHFDQNCFDPGYDSLPLEHFRPILEEVFGRSRYAADELPQ